MDPRGGEDAAISTPGVVVGFLPSTRPRQTGIRPGISASSHIIDSSDEDERENKKNRGRWGR